MFIAACSKDCLQCYSERECSICNCDTYLKGGYCVRDCGKDYIINEDLRECSSEYRDFYSSLAFRHVIFCISGMLQYRPCSLATQVSLKADLLRIYTI